MFNLIDSVSSWIFVLILKTIDQSGYFGIFILSVLESAAIPIPSEIVVPFAGFLAQQGKFILWILVVLVSLANLAGSVGVYWIARIWGRPVLEKFGRYILITNYDLDKAEILFQNHGPKFVFIGRLLPVIRTFISIPAGVARMNFFKFSFFTFFGSLPWNLVLALVGFKAGENWDILSDYFHRFNFVIVGIIAVGVIWYIKHHVEYHRKI